MTPPWTAGTMGDRTRKRVEWSSTNGTNSAEDPAGGMWDSEADHLLNYFLGGEGQQHGVPSPPQNYSNAGHTNNLSHSGSTVHHPSTVQEGQQPNTEMNSHSHSHQASSMAFDDDDDHDLPPPTPAIQYYHPYSQSSMPSRNSSRSNTGGHHQTIVPRPPPHSYHPSTSSHHQHRSRSSPMPVASQSSSMSVMAASLVNGGPVMHQQMQQQQQHQHHQMQQMHMQQHQLRQGSSTSPAPEGISPLSPAGTIGMGHEPLMLPPPTMHPAQQHVQQHHRQQQQQQQILPPQPQINNHGHLEWLREINELAKAAGPIYPPPVSHSLGPPPVVGHSSGEHQQQTIMPPPSHTQPPPSHPGMPTTIMSGYPGGIPVHHPSSAGSMAPPGPMYFAQAAMAQAHHQAAQSAGESEEKRARRLERNRESARKSRRRKKERLSQLEEQVAGLHTEIEKERRKEINTMEKSLLESQERRIIQFREEYLEKADANQELKERLLTLVQMTGPNCPVRRAVVEFQYSTLRNIFLPRHQKILLWLTLHPEAYFTAGKEQYAKREGKQVPRVTTAKVSSKQIGEELTNGPKVTEEGAPDSSASSTSTSAKKDKKGKKGKNNDESEEEKAAQVAQAFDAPKMWPLICFELSISVDQEERFLQTHKRLRQLGNLPNDRSQISAATRMASTLKKAVMYQGHAAALRSEKSYIDILTPTQTMLYQEWLAANRTRCSEVLSQKRASKGAVSNSKENSCLLDVCRKLEELLKISDSS